MNKKLLLITGANGFIGGHLIKQARSHWEIAAVRHTGEAPISGADKTITLDIADKDRVALALKSLSPNVVIHCAAASSIDYCAGNRDAATAVNIAGTEHIARACACIGSHLVSVSTDLVFDGSSGYYNEMTQPNPICYYGHTKAEAERIVIATNASFAIARLAWVYGRSANGKTSFLDGMIERFERREPVTLFCDEFRSPAYVEDICSGLLALAETGVAGIFHLAGQERMSRLEFGIKTAEVFGFDKSLIKSVSSDLAESIDKRPKDCSLLSTRTTNSPVRFRSVVEGLSAIKDRC